MTDEIQMPAQPPLPSWVWLHGDSLPATVRTRLEAALRAAGHYVSLDRTSSWHAARAGLPVIEVNVPMADAYDDCAPIAVQRVRARYAKSPHHFEKEEEAEMQYGTAMELVPVAGEPRPRPRLHAGGPLDIDTIVAWVGELLDRRIIGSGMAGAHVGLDPRDVRARQAKGTFAEPDGYEPRGKLLQPWWYTSTLDAWQAARQRGGGRPARLAANANEVAGTPPF